MRKSDGHATAPDAGFSMLETLAALTILAIALIGLFEANATSFRTGAVAAETANARILAQNLLANAATRETPIGSRHGHDGRFTWTIAVEDETAPWANLPSNGNWRMHRVSVRVSWDAHRQLELTTLRLARSGTEPRT